MGFRTQWIDHVPLFYEPLGTLLMLMETTLLVVVVT